MISACKQANQNSNSQPALKCGIENCHGLDISCGPNPNAPEVCTQEYALGDFCRKFASCKAIDGQCKLEQSSKLERCKMCVDACKGLNFQQIFECEADCRKKFE